MKRHRFDPFAFLFGAVFLTIGLTVASGGSGVEAVRPFRSWPTAVILTGLVLVVWTVSRVLRPEAGESPAELEEAASAVFDEDQPIESPAKLEEAASAVFDEDQPIESPAELDASDTAELDEGPPP